MAISSDGTNCRQIIVLSVLLVLFGLCPASAKIYEISAADAEQLVQRWLSSQNQGDFKSYEQLYADRFTGIRRSGNRTVPMNRTRWMEDRRKMFAKPMKVEAGELSIIPGNVSAIVTFVQSWESKTYKDKGRKQIVLVRDSKGQLKIGQEEMLESKIALHQPSLPNDRLDFAFMLGGYVILPGQPGDNWSEGVPSLISVSPALAVADAQSSALPKYAKAWKGKLVRVYGRSGNRCSGSLGKIVIIAAVIPHFGKVQQWEGKIPGQEESSTKVPDHKIANDIWQEGDKYLAAEFNPEARSCSEGVWAQSASLPTATVVQGHSADSGLRQEILTQFHATKGYIEAGRQNGKNNIAVWDGAEDSETKVQIFSYSKGDYVTVATQSGNPCSDGFFAESSAVGKLIKSGQKPTVQWVGSFEQYLNIHEAIDSEGPGTPWFRFEAFPSKSGILGLTNGTYQTIQELQIPFHDCPC